MIIPLTALAGAPSFDRRRKKRFPLPLRIAGYLFIGFVVYLLLPKPLNIPLLNLYSLVIGVIFAFCIARNEVSPYWKVIRAGLASYTERKLRRIVGDGKAT